MGDSDLRQPGALDSGITKPIELKFGTIDCFASRTRPHMSKLVYTTQGWVGVGVKLSSRVLFYYYLVFSLLLQTTPYNAA